MAEFATNPLLVNIFCGLVANGLFGLGTALLHRGENYRADIHDLIATSTTIVDVVEKACTKLSEYSGESEKGMIEEIGKFLSTPGAEALVRQMYCHTVIGDEGPPSSTIKDEFEACLSSYLNRSRAELRDVADELFAALIEVCRHVINICDDKRMLVVLDANSSIRFNLLRDELANVTKNLEFLGQADSLRIDEVLDFESKYRDEVGNRHSTITPPQFDAAQRVPIDDLYVTPRFTSDADDHESFAEPIGYQEFLSSLYRAVVLGNPGSGKTTLCQKIIHDIAAHYDHRAISDRELTPVYVVLREFAIEKELHSCSVVQFMSWRAESTYQQQFPEGSFEYLLLNGHIFVIFDGLDELLDTNSRQEIRSDIESFCRAYPTVPVLVTSREVGYEQAPLDDEMFKGYRLAELSVNSIKEYAEKWFALDSDITPEQTATMVDAFLAESESVPDLRSNALMLALMCNLYKGEGYIPRNRTDVYEKCALMLFDRWDRGRGIKVTLPIEAHVRNGMMFLAHWIYSDTQLQAGVSENALVTKTSDYLQERRYEDRAEADLASQTFIEFCRGRAWVFTDTGTTKDGERLYQFTHRTFLEYFTASHLCRIHQTPEELAAVLTPRIGNREWDVVAQLAFQIQNKNLDGAGDYLLTSLVDGQEKESSITKLNMLSFASRCLEFMVPSPKVTRKIAESGLSWCFTPKGDRGISEGPENTEILFSRPMGPQSIFGPLEDVTEENLPVVYSVLETGIVDRLNSDDVVASYMAVELCDLLGGFSRMLSIRSNQGNEDRVKFWQQNCRQIRNDNAETIFRLRSSSRDLAARGYIRGDYPIESLIEHHGINGALMDGEFQLIDGKFTSVANILLISAGDDFRRIIPTKKSPEDIATDIGYLGARLLEIEPPWINDPEGGFRHSFGRLRYRINVGEEGADSHFADQLNPGELFGAFLLAAIEFEVEHSRDESQPEMPDNPLSSILKRIDWIIQAKNGGLDGVSIRENLNQSRFDEIQKSFVLKWIQDEINLVSRE